MATLFVASYAIVVAMFMVKFSVSLPEALARISPFALIMGAAAFARGWILRARRLRRQKQLAEYEQDFPNYDRPVE